MIYFYRYSEDQKTEWFGCDVKPDAPGFYEVRNKPGEYGKRSRFWLTGRIRKWDGNRWLGGWLWKEASIFGSHRAHQWRGLRSDPGAQ